MSLLAAGAGLLARGVSALFSGETSLNRQKRREERKSKREGRRAERTAQKIYYEQLEAEQAKVTRGYGTTRGDVPTGGATSQRPDRGTTEYVEMAKKYWWAIAIAILFFTPFGKKLMRPPRRAPRRRPKPKVVTRYRTRKAPVRRRK